MKNKKDEVYHRGAMQWVRRSLAHRDTQPYPMRWSRVPTAAALDSSLSATDYQTLILLTRYVSAFGCCYVNQSTLADFRGVSRQMIGKSLARLAEREWICWQQMFRPIPRDSTNRRERTASWYTIHYPLMPDQSTGSFTVATTAEAT